jgi:ribosome maturation factor RimP
MIALTEQERRILSLATPVAESLGMEIVRLRIQGGRRPHLQIMARALSPVLEAEDPIREAYTLEVSTPGIDRPLTREGDFARWVGHLAKVELARPIDSRRRFTGVITGEDEDGAHLELDDDTELVAHVHEMSRASLVLTDELIEATRAAGQLPPQPDEEGLGDLEIDETEDETDTNEETGDVK